MIRASVELVGGKAVVSSVDAFGAGLREGMRDGIQIAAAQLARDVAGVTPFKTGLARRSIVVKIGGDRKSATLSFSGSLARRITDKKQNEAFYMKFVILGSKAHVIAPRKRGKRAQFNQLSRGLLVKGQASSLMFESGGETFFRRAVLHPGTKPNPLWSRELAKATGKIESTIRSSMEMAARRKLATRNISGDEWIRARGLGLI